ncbi:MAG TPA: hypothetical protein VNU66_13280 [Mycobacteriales bacterium]|nr:hypothetical protein [Mycobacteriales bacterium]
MRTGARTAAASVVAALLVLLLAPAASAHPLGLPAFATAVAEDARTVVVTWTASPDDIAVLARSLGLPAGEDGLTEAQDARLTASPRLQVLLESAVRVRQDGRPCPTEARATASVVREGVVVAARCPRPVDEVALTIALLHDVDARYRTLTTAAGPAGAVRHLHTAASPERNLRLDPGAAGLLPAARPQTSAGTGVRGAFGGALPLERRLVTALDTSTGPVAAAVALLVALAVGAVHALAPGHGKAVAAAYLVAGRGRVRDAALLGLVVAVMHCGSVLALGLALWSASRVPDVGRLGDALQLVTGLVVAALGAWMLLRRRRPRGAEAPMTREGLVALGTAGGLLPSPSALLVLLSALALGRTALGLGLVAAFSAGLAATVTLTGVLALRGRDVLHRRAHERAADRLHRLLHAAPALGAVAVLVVGTVVAVRAATGFA